MVDRIEVYGRINEEGKLEVDLPANLPPGRVHVIVEPVELNDQIEKFAQGARQFGVKLEELGMTEEQVNGIVEEVRQELHKKRHSLSKP